MNNSRLQSMMCILDVYLQYIQYIFFPVLSQELTIFNKIKVIIETKQMPWHIKFFFLKYFK